MTTYSDISAYRQEIFNFLKTVSIKFTPLCDRINQNLLLKGQAVDASMPETWKYYLNLVGEYHSTDTMMTVVSLDTKETINFTKENLSIHTRTAAAYEPGSTYHTDLCTRYPEQTDLIKSIMYPASDISTCINADDFTILSFGSGFLEEAEEGVLITELEKGIAYIVNRWYMAWMSYEVYYTWVFWMALWMHLSVVLFAARIHFIKSPFVHSWHIWQYLTSRGLDDYSDVLDRKTSLWLYRNMEYLLENGGKQTNLVLLKEHILDEMGVGLYGRYIYEQTDTNAAICKLTPELVAMTVPSESGSIASDLPISTIADMNDRLVSAGDEVNNTAEYVSEVTDKLGASTFNILPTKILEIRPVVKTRRWTDFLNQFLMDTMVYSIVNNIYTAHVSFVDPKTGVSIYVTTREALALYNYCCWKSEGWDPTDIPTTYYSTSAFTKDPVTVPTNVYRDGVTYVIAQMLNVTAFMSGTTYPLSINQTPDAFTKMVSTLFLSALRQYNACAYAVDYMQLAAMRALVNSCTVRGVITYNLIPGVTDYATWLGPDYMDYNNTMFYDYEKSDDPKDLYASLADVIFAALLPVTDTMILYGNFTLSTAAYKKLRRLFIQMCSYNVTFLDTDRSVTKFVPLYQSLLYQKASAYHTEMFYPCGVPITLAVGYKNIIHATSNPRQLMSVVSHAGYTIEHPQMSVTLKHSVGYLIEAPLKRTVLHPVPKTSSTVSADIGRGCAFSTNS